MVSERDIMISLEIAIVTFHSGCHIRMMERNIPLYDVLF